MTVTEWILDKLATVAHSWKLVSLGTLVAGPFCSFIEPVYTARMVVPHPKSAP